MGEHEFNSKMKQFLKEMNLTLAEKDREFQETFSSAIEKSSRMEETMAHQHSREMEEMHNDLHEKDQQMEELLEEHEVQLQLKDEEKLTACNDLKKKIAELRQQLQAKDDAYEKER